MTSRPCPLCGQTDAPLFLKKGELQLVRCNECGMVFASPVAAELVSGSFYDQLAEPYYLSRDKLQSDYSPVRFERELRIFRAYCQSGTVLDVGCSTGGFLSQLTKRFPGDYTVWGNDVVGAALDYAQSQGAQVIRESFLDFDFGELKFDAITFWAVIEHLAQPRQFLSKAASLLRPQGHCIILAPNLNSLAVRLLGSKYRYIMPEHVNYFTPATLKRFAHTAPELETVALASTHFNPLVILKDLVSRGKMPPDAERARLLSRTTHWKQNKLLQPVKLVYNSLERVLTRCYLADNLVIVLRKKTTQSPSQAGIDP